MVHLIILCVLFYFKSVYCQNGDLPKNIVLDENVNNITKLCKEKICIPKCCDKNEIMLSDELSCFMITDKANQDVLYSYLENIPLYDNYYHDRKVNKKLSDVFFLVPRKFNERIIYENEEQNFTDVGFVGSDYGYIEYLSEGGYLYMEYPNSYSRWTTVSSSHFCVDIDNEMMAAKFFTVVEINIPEGTSEYYAIALIISSVFLFVVLLVYMALPELRNLAGLIFIAYVFSLLNAFISLAWMKLGELSDLECIILTGFIYFFFLSSFCWMSVMSYDIWCTFRGYVKVCEINRRGEVLTFKMYCIFAWGVPMIMTIGFLIINHLDLSHIPWFIKPQVPELGCFLVDGQQFVYFYIPILILLVCNWFFFLMTAFNMWRLARGTTILNSAQHSQKNRFMVYLKLSVVMGINWLLEILGYLTPELPIWPYIDAYNFLMGFFIFLVLLWKKKIYKKLKARLIVFLRKYYKR